tara:strand:+ start:4809 stop:6149 length:1341 start_codon:yes stop_codon:yes gene_type:complete
MTEEVKLNEEIVEETKAAELTTETIVVEQAVEVEEKDEEIVEEKAVEAEISLKDIADALEEKSAKTESLIEAKVSIEEMNEVKADADTKIKTLTDVVEELQAKSNRPSVIHSIKKETKMENKDILGIFARKGIEGLQAKAGDLQITVDAQGGYSLPVEMNENILMLQRETSPMRQVCGSITTNSTDYSQLVSIGAAASGWVGETDARAKTDAPELTKISAVFGEIYAAPKAYQHVLEDSFFNVEAWLNGEVSREFNEQEGVSFLNGNGTNKPKGILHGLADTSAYLAGDATRDFGKFQVVKTGQAATLGATADDVINKLRDLVLATKTGYLPGAKFMMNRATHSVLVDMKNADGEYFLQRDIASAAGTKIFGYDIVINEDMADIGAGNIAIIFGDFGKAYSIIDRVGVSVLRDPYSAYGAISFYTRKRVGSMTLNTEALKVLLVGA